MASQTPAKSTVLLGLHLARNGLHLLPVLLAFPVILLDFAYLGEKIFELNREILIGYHEFRQDQHVADGNGAAPQVLAQLDDFVDNQRRARESLANRPLAPLVALG